MAYEEFMADRIRNAFTRAGTGWEEKKMMGGLVFMVDDKMCVGLHIDKKLKTHQLMARIGKEFYEQALLEPAAREMDFTGRLMRGFVFIDEPGYDTEDNLDFWIAKALEYNKTIPAKK